MEELEIKENNEKFWLMMTKEGTLPYCHEMLKLSVEFQSKKDPDTPYELHLKTLDSDIQAYMDNVVRHTHDKTWNMILPEESPFPKDLHAYIHEYGCAGKFQPNHLMCKLAALRDDEHKLVYEFLIEYDIFESDVEIYFGVKAVSDSWITTPQFQQLVINQWNKVKEKGAYKRHLHRFKNTNNGNNGTFWPFWWRMGMDCKEELSDAIMIIRKFYDDYKKTLELEDFEPPKFDRIQEEVENSLRASKDYEKLLSCIRDDFSVEVIELFESLIDHCIEEGIVRRKKSEELMYICLKPATRIVCLLRVFFYTMTWIYCKGKAAGSTPVTWLSKVFLDKNGRTINDKTWQKTENSAYSAWVSAKKSLRNWFPDIEIKGERRK
ncbi:MAG: hypothetical protein K2L45_05205 [Muribaculaceae bacterium]|nr:hypothetical protein [Muribaculaceae bacterium]